MEQTTTLNHLSPEIETPAISTVRDYISLLKPRVMSLVVFTGAVGIMLAPGTLHPFLAIMAVLCIALGSGAAGAINMWYDRDIDAIMTRTQSRPIPAGKIHPDEALHFGCMLAGLSVLMMTIALNMTAGLLLLGAILFYVVIYTLWLKRSTPQNIVIGGAAGAFPPMIGWAAVTGNVTVDSFILFLIIFMWTPPHFWALALYKSDDYEKAGVPMLPVVSGNLTTIRQMMIYSILLLGTTLLPVATGLSGLVYGVATTLLGLRLCWYNWQLFDDKELRYAPKMFGFSILYLFAVYTLFVVDKYFFIPLM